jgi:subtilisin family serine protease
MAPAARVIPANFMDQNGGGSLGDAINAINYVASRGARVINASWGGEFCSTALRDAVASLEARNKIYRFFIGLASCLGTYLTG